MTKHNPGVEFEKLVSNIQQLFDPTASVLHDQILTDRLNQKRQFDVVIRGSFSGYPILGVIECKDLNRKVGTPEIDSFHTKSTDVNSNFKVIVSRKGFSKTAILKAKHYGIQTFSLLPSQDSPQGFVIGTWWFAHIHSWNEIQIVLNFDNPDQKQLSFDPMSISIDNKKIIDWFSNYLLKIQKPTEFLDEGWHGIELTFKNPQKINLYDDINVNCLSINFKVLKKIDKRQKFIGISGDAFYDWQTGQMSFPAGVELVTDAVSIEEVSKWESKNEKSEFQNEFIYAKIDLVVKQFSYIEDIIEIDKL